MKMNALSKNEFAVIQNTKFLISKKKAIQKIRGILTTTQIGLEKTLIKSPLNLPESIRFSAPKISQGENYRSLPYLLLDYPATFSKSNIFAYRTLFWWGHFFSATLHLQGDYLSFYRSVILENFNDLLENEIYISVGKTPWEYHYNSDNYQLITQKHYSTLNNCSFLKLSKKADLDKWDEIPDFSKDFLSFLLNKILK
jgi:hypothetical protein